MRALALALILVASQTSAQPPKPDGMQVEPLAAEAIHNFAACVVRASALAPRRVLAMDYRAPEYREALRKLGRGFGRCTPNNELRTAQILFAGGLAEALLAPSRGQMEGWWAGQVRAGLPIKARSESEAMTLCTVRTAPELVAALFASTPMSAEEAAAIAPLQPVLAKCLGNGEMARMNRPGLRAILATAAYRLVENGAPAGAQGS